MKGMGNPDDFQQIMQVGNQVHTVEVCHNYQDNHFNCKCT